MGPPAGPEDGAAMITLLLAFALPLAELPPGKTFLVLQPHHADHTVAKKQMRHPGAMLSFELKGGLEAGIRFMNKLKLCVRTVSLGTCDTLLSHPASMTHYSVPKEEKEKYGITDGLIRMNVGIENIQDIIADLSQSLET